MRSVTLADVARLAGVSRTTVAKVLLGTGGDHVRVSEGTRQRVVEASAELRYRPNRAAQRLAGARTKTLGILMDTVNALVMNDRLAAIEQEASLRGYRLLIGQVHNRASVLGDYLADFDSRGVDAILCLFDLTLERNERVFPVLGHRRDIVYHGMPLKPNDYCVRVDTAKAITMLVAHLLASGRRRIGIELWNLKDALVVARRDAYCNAMAAHRVACDLSLMWMSTPDLSCPAQELLDQAISYLVDVGRADAIIASNDIRAVRLVQALKRRGVLVPETVAVTGYDNLELSTVVDPALTTIDQDHAAYARAVLDSLVAVAEGRDDDTTSHTVTIEPKLVVRESSAAGS